MAGAQAPGPRVTQKDRWSRKPSLSLHSLPSPLSCLPLAPHLRESHAHRAGGLGQAKIRGTGFEEWTVAIEDP